MSGHSSLSAASEFGYPACPAVPEAVAYFAGGRGDAGLRPRQPLLSLLSRRVANSVRAGTAKSNELKSKEEPDPGRSLRGSRDNAA